MEVDHGEARDDGRIASVVLEDSSQVGEARRAAQTLAAEAGVDETDRGRVSIIVSEAATNILKHAGSGEIILRSLVRPDGAGIEMIAIDAGPGIPDLERALRDGYSTAGSGGNGLGAIRRLATAFDIHTAPGGTVLVARIWRPAAAAPSGAAAAPFEIGVVRVPKRGEVACGDDWSIVFPAGGGAIITVADGLGHGQAAAVAATTAVRVAAERARGSAAEALGAIHAALRATRGAAVAVAVIPARGPMSFAGIGNISGALVAPASSRSLVSHNGIAGHEARRIQEFPYDWPEGGMLILHSDGLSARWDLERYPGLPHGDPSIIAGVLYRDFTRGRDDAIVVVARRTS